MFLPVRMPPMPPRPAVPRDSKDQARFRREKARYLQQLNDFNESTKTQTATMIVALVLASAGFLCVVVYALWEMFGMRGPIFGLTAALLFVLAVYEVRKRL